MTKQTASAPRTAIAVSPMLLAALKAYSTWYSRPSGEKMVLQASKEAGAGRRTGGGAALLWLGGSGGGRRRACSGAAQPQPIPAGCPLRLEPHMWRS